MSGAAIEKKSVAKSLVKGLIAGMIGGIAGIAAKHVAEKIYPPSAKVPGTALVPATAKEEAVPWLFGASAGAVYGGVAEYYPQVTAKEGASFGMVMGTVAHEGVLPAIGVATNQSSRAQASEMTSHMVYGVVTEIVRAVVRKML